MGAAGAERARRDFCWDTRADALHAVIQRMMLENGSISLSSARALSSEGEQP
jgi:hypothetical protein